METGSIKTTNYRWIPCPMQAHTEKYPQNFIIHKISSTVLFSSSTLMASSTLPAASAQQQWFTHTYLPFLSALPELFCF